MNSSNPLSGPDPKHGRAVDADIDENALGAVGPTPALDPAVEPDPGLRGIDL